MSNPLLTLRVPGWEAFSQKKQRVSVNRWVVLVPTSLGVTCLGIKTTNPVGTTENKRFQKTVKY